MVPLPELLLIHTAVDGDRALLYIHGEVDLVTGPRLDHALADVIVGGARHVHVDLAEVTFCDSTLVHTLLRARSRAHSYGAALSLAPGGWPRRLLELTGTKHLFTLRPTPTASPAADPGPEPEPA
ncbi:STAS domain-containing protein [Embleya sp. AB8]|uniref:STAS domain-containing protein n=1 Tax=Embleya sp. AB8 TaxID=3156304 RepID=UPI003C71606B